MKEDYLKAIEKNIIETNKKINHKLPNDITEIISPFKIIYFNLTYCCITKNKEKYKQYLKLEEDLANRLDIKEIMNHQVVFENSSNLFYNENELFFSKSISYLST